jgi:tetratricopeptide (TPR) repeat protein
MQTALQYAPNHPPLLEALARLELQRGDLMGAQANAQKLVQVSRRNPAGHLYLGKALARQRQFAPARAEFLAAQKLAPADPAIDVDLAQAFIGERNAPEAEKALEDALRLNPRYLPALAQLTALWVDEKQEARALESLHEYLGKYPGDAGGHFLLGELESNRQRFDEAEAELERATQLDPKMVAAYEQLGRLEQRRGNLDAAVARYQRALALEPKSVELLTLLGNLSVVKGDLGKAAPYYESALALDSGAALAANGLAWVYAVQNRNLDEAVELAQRAKRLLPDVDAVSDTLGWVYCQKRFYIAAVPLLQECVNKSPRHAVYHYHLGVALLGSGDRTRGREQLDAALRGGLAGDDAQQAREALARLH